MTVKIQRPLPSLNPAYRKEKVRREDIDRLKSELPLFLERAAGKVSESQLRDHFQTFLRRTSFPQTDFLVQSEVNKMDTIIHNGPSKKKDSIGLIAELKTRDNKREMFSPEKPNTKSLHELVLYFLRERRDNAEIKHLMISDGADVYLFPDREFDRLFWNKKRFRDKVLTADDDKPNNVAYEIIEKYIAELDDTLHCTAVDLTYYLPYCKDGREDTDDHLIPLQKILSPFHLLRKPFAGDSNTLDKRFYQELLHIIGLYEVNKKKGKVVKSGGKKVIERLPEGQRNPASLLENTLRVATKQQRFRHIKNLKSYGANEEEQRFAVILELCLTWINRTLFIKLLETQLLGYHDGNQQYRILTLKRIPGYDALSSLFLDVLNTPKSQREKEVDEFRFVPYLNSSLFEINDLEDQIFHVGTLKERFDLPLADRSVLAGQVKGDALPPLEYLFRFLDAYDFGAQGKASIQEDNKQLINASVLGLIFEKINGYRDGSFYTPGFITEYMCRETIRRAVTRKFREDTAAFADFDSDKYDDLRTYLNRNSYKSEVRLAANKIVNTITVCDPAVGSGHFLVSALNELIATKSDLGILGADAGAGEVPVKAEVENDELLLSYDRGGREGEPYEYHVTTLAGGQLDIAEDVQLVQRTLFQEKRTLIENCLFGVDLNPNSVKICRLRLWIELLKHAYYDAETQRLQTLPNIDINIKQGNSLISRVGLDQPLGRVMQQAGMTVSRYKATVNEYFRAKSADEKQPYLLAVEKIKSAYSTFLAAESKLAKRIRKEESEFYLRYEADNLFGTDEMVAQMTAAQKKEYKRRKESLAKLRTEAKALEDNVIYDQAFEWRFEFPAVLGEDGEYLGFDVVVGNPPYVRQEEFKDLSKHYETKFSVSSGKADLYVYFYELASLLISQTGIVSFITSNKFFSANYGKPLLRYLVTSTTIRDVIDFGDSDVFEGVSAYPVILTFDMLPMKNYDFRWREVMEEQKLVFSSVEPILVNVDDFTSNGYTVMSKKTAQIVAKMVRRGSSFEKLYKPPLVGVKTGYNTAYIMSDSIDYVHPWVFGRDIEKYCNPQPSKSIIYPYDEGELVKESDLPTRVLANLAAHKEQLSRRAVIKEGLPNGTKKWYEYQQVNHGIKLNDEVIVYPNVSLGSNFTISKGAIIDITAFVIPSSDKWLLGILNSRLAEFFIELYTIKRRGGYSEFKKQYVTRLPIIETDEKSNITSLTTQILQKKSQSPTADTSALEAEIDVLVYKLYGLTHGEVLVVDPEFGLTEAEYGAVEV